MALGDLTTLLIISAVVLAVVVASLIVFFAMRRGRKTASKPKQAEREPDLKGLPFKLSKSVQSSDATSAKDELRILD